MSSRSTVSRVDSVPGTPFDPLRDLLVAQDSRPEHIRPIKLRTLSPYHRALLVIDGTVTKFLEAFTMEPVVVQRLGQDTLVTEAPHRWLDVDAGSQLIVREVLLTSTRTGTVLAHAASLLVTERLDPELQDGLDTNPEGLGRILLDAQLETRREVLWFGRERAVGIPPAVEQRTGADFITRTYRVIHQQRPLMMITERFPAEVDPTPAHH